MKHLFLTTLLLILSGCVAYPKVIHQNSYKQCDLISKRFKLETVNLTPNCHSIECLAAHSVVGVSTAVVSGSIMVVGNFVYWIEKQGKCEDSEFNQQIARIKAKWSAEETYTK